MKYAKLIYKVIGTDEEIIIGYAFWDEECKKTEFKYYDLEKYRQNYYTEQDKLLIKAAVEDIKYWGNWGLPYPNCEVKKYTDNFWDIVRQLLIHRVRLGETNISV